MARLSVFRGNELLTSFVLGQAPLTLGRGHTADVHVPDTRLSRKHCRVELLDQHVVVTDLDSTNGIFYKGKPVRAQHLAERDEFLMGDIRVTVEPEHLKAGTIMFEVPDDESGGMRGDTAVDNVPVRPQSEVPPAPTSLVETARRIEQASNGFSALVNEFEKALGSDPGKAELLARFRALAIELEVLAGN